jgi:hypothetical protein
MKWSGRAGKKATFDFEWFGDDFTRLIEEHSDEALYAAGEVLRSAAASRAPSKRGMLAGSGYVRTSKRSSYVKRHRLYRGEFALRGSKVAMVAFAVWYANLFEDTGAKRHVMPDGTARAARKNIYLPGVGYRKSARHPGMRKRPFVAPALEASKETLAQKIVEILKQRTENEMGV